MEQLPSANLWKAAALFVFYLTTVLRNADYTASNEMVITSITKGKGLGRKSSWPNLRYYQGIGLKGLMTTTRNLSQDSQFTDRDLNPRPPEYEAVVTLVTKREHIFRFLK
jgi:hypothetical protein